MAFHFPRRFAATAVLAALALPLLAQQAPTPPAAATAGAAAPQARQMAGEGRHAQRAAMHHADRAQHRAQRMAALRDQLKLTAAQESAWTAFTTSMQPGERTARLDRQGMDQLTTPERIDRMRALRAQRAAEADRRGEATKTFYAVLTPEQQKTFDAQAHRGHRMSGMKGMGGDGEGRHHGHHGHQGKRGGGMGAAQQPATPAK